MSVVTRQALSKAVHWKHSEGLRDLRLSMETGVAIAGHMHRYLRSRRSSRGSLMASVLLDKC